MDALSRFRQWIESVNDTLKGQLGLEDHGARTAGGVLARVGQLGEGWQFEEVADVGVDRFVLVHDPIRAEGAVSTISPATAIANLRDADDVGSRQR